MKINQAGLDLIMRFEGCELEAYQDVVGIWTIAYGHTGKDVYEGLRIDQDEAEALLRADLSRTEDGIWEALKEDCSPNQFSALVCFAFNVGVEACRKSTLMRMMNSGDIEGAADQFLRWTKAGGKVVKGLTRRREAERDLFLAD